MSAIDQKTLAIVLALGMMMLGVLALASSDNSSGVETLPTPYIYQGN